MLSVNVKDKFSPVVRKLTIPTLDTKHLEESKPGFMKNWCNEKEHLEETHIRSLHEVEELKRVQEMRIDKFSTQELRERSGYYTRAHITDTGSAG